MGVLVGVAVVGTSDDAVVYYELCNFSSLASAAKSAGTPGSVPSAWDSSSTAGRDVRSVRTWKLAGDWGYICNGESGLVHGMGKILHDTAHAQSSKKGGMRSLWTR
jgi:hypothetical protein